MLMDSLPEIHPNYMTAATEMADQRPFHSEDYQRPFHSEDSTDPHMVLISK